jgi:CO dehydrogenase/acetyl-CoA synthase alpha subunit
LVFEGKLPASGVIFFGNQKPALEDSPFDEDVAIPVSPTAPATASDAAKEREKTVTLTGKLKSKPQAGKNDRSNKPTAYADFAAHVAGEKAAHDYIATFHRHTRDIALNLPTEAQITVTGYPHPSNKPRRKDTLSVINILEYPGKPPLRPKKR